jgi:hypothetical protein
MASTLAMNGGNDFLGQVMDRLYRFADRASNSRLGDLLSTTGIVKPSVSPFGDFGVVVAAGSRPLPIAHAIKEVTVFTVEEARERLNSFISGRFAPTSVTDLLSYLNDKFVRLETRITNHGFVNYLVDLKTNGAVAAAQVDPRLSHARMLAMSIKTAVYQHFGNGSPLDVWSSWEGMKMDLDYRNDNLAYTVVRGEGWIGRAYATASSDPRENLMLLREARAKGIDLIIPERTAGAGGNGVLIAGLPILVRSRSMKAVAVHPDLAHDNLAREWNLGMDEAYAKMSERARTEVNVAPKQRPARVAAPASVISMSEYKKSKPAQAAPSKEEFLKKFAKPAVSRNDGFGFGGNDAEAGFGVGFGADASDKPRDLVVRISSEDGESYVFDKDLNEEVFLSPRALPPNRYPLESQDGAPLGFAEIGKGGSFRRLDEDGKPFRPPQTRPVADETASTDHAPRPSMQRR